MKQPTKFHNSSVPKIYGYGKQTIEDDDIKAVVETFKERLAYSGPESSEF